MIQMHPDMETLSRGAAALFVSCAKEACEARGRFAVALSGGHTPQRVYQLLAETPYRGRVAWDRVHVFWGDERCVPEEDPRSNTRMAREAFLDKLDIPRDQIHPIRCAFSPLWGAQSYDEELRSFFGEAGPRFDLVFLGLGENGHTASLFPGTPVLEEYKRWAAEVYVAEQEMYRVTLTAGAINEAAVAVFLVSGRSKAQVVKEVLQGPADPARLPAQLIRPRQGKLIWLLDDEAAALL